MFFENQPIKPAVRAVEEEEVPIDFTTGFLNLLALKGLCDQAQSRKMLGIDWGEVRIGIAVSDSLGIVATPLCTLSRPKKTKGEEAGGAQNNFITRIIKIIEEEAPVAVVIGLPKNMNGSAGAQVKKVVSFARELKNRVLVPVLLQDERLSSVAIERFMVTADVTRKKRRDSVDKAAAAFVLQGVIDFVSHEQPTEQPTPAE